MLPTKIHITISTTTRKLNTYMRCSTFLFCMTLTFTGTCIAMQPDGRPFIQAHATRNMVPLRDLLEMAPSGLILHLNNQITAKEKKLDAHTTKQADCKDTLNPKT